MVALIPPPPPHVSSDPGMLSAVIALAAGLIVVTFWLRGRRLSPAAWVGRMEAGGPAVWRVPNGLRAPERVRGRVSWGSDATYVEALAETVLRRVRRRPPPALVRGFAADVLGELSDDGFVLDEREVRAWLNTRSATPEHFAREVIG
jgi:hypothetical protein